MNATPRTRADIAEAIALIRAQAAPVAASGPESAWAGVSLGVFRSRLYSAAAAHQQPARQGT